MLIFCCVRSTDKTKALLPIYSLCNRFELTRIYIETMATTSESGNESTASEVFQCRKVRSQHILLVLWLQHLPIPAYIMASLVKSLLVKGFGIVNDRTDTCLILNVQSCGLQWAAMTQASYILSLLLYACVCYSNTCSWSPTAYSLWRLLSMRD